MPKQEWILKIEKKEPNKSGSSTGHTRHLSAAEATGARRVVQRRPRRQLAGAPRR